MSQNTSTHETELPYAAVSHSGPDGRAMEWEGPLWDAIHEWASVPPTSRGPAVCRVIDAVHAAMRLAIQTSRPVDIAGMRVVVDRSIPPGEVHVRDQDGRTVTRLTNAECGDLAVGSRSPEVRPESTSWSERLRREAEALERRHA